MADVAAILKELDATKKEIRAVSAELAAAKKAIDAVAAQIAPAGRGVKPTEWWRGRMAEGLVEIAVQAGAVAESDRARVLAAVRKALDAE